MGSKTPIDMRTPGPEFMNTPGRGFQSPGPEFLGGFTPTPGLKSPAYSQYERSVVYQDPQHQQAKPMNIFSPQYPMASPSYGAPSQTIQSPRYMAQSPHLMNYASQSPVNAMSPSYSPGGRRFSPASPNYYQSVHSPQYGQNAYSVSPASPNYSGSPLSQNLSPSSGNLSVGQSNIYSPNSPQYNLPTAQYNPKSPVYDPNNQLAGQFQSSSEEED